jgi:hypothetical protein
MRMWNSSAMCRSSLVARELLVGEKKLILSYELCSPKGLLLIRLYGSVGVRRQEAWVSSIGGRPTR